ncbi:hypothetical protein P4H46_08160 [Paenibacillus glucanolyticus]|uniref:aminoacyl--tRNA ligase-related protein n=1 Tax=Paenibacillus glucanolyticus TaxID=59843 RepID=UPI0030C926F6
MNNGIDTADKALYSIAQGLATFGEGAIKIVEKLDSIFLELAREVNAEYNVYPPLMKVQELARLDYFKNFPHLGLTVSQLSPESCDCFTNDTSVDAIQSEYHLDSHYMLPSAACYNIYLNMQGQVLPQTKYVTTIARCYRNENEYNELKRLWSFQMREIVCIGSTEDVQTHLKQHKTKILSLAEKLGLQIEIQVATDPFYDKDGSKALLQRLDPVKEEFVYGSSVSIASVNYHRNFFGERCNIKDSSGNSVFSGCVAFGIERWLHALLETYDQNIDVILEKLKL